MTPQQIVDRVNSEASARFIEVIERVLPVLRNRHAHKACLRECWCDYCRFIQNTYTAEKIHLHRTKARLNRFGNDYWDDEEMSLSQVQRLSNEVYAQKFKVRELKAIKNELKTEVL